MSLIPKNITKEHILLAIKRFDNEGLPDTNADSQYYDLVFRGKHYPPKVIISYANKFANGEDLDRRTFTGGTSSQSFQILKNFGYKIVEKQNDTKIMKNNNLVKCFINALDNYKKEKTTAFPGSGKMKNLFTIQIPEILSGYDSRLKHVGAIGKGNWAAIPWVASMDSDLTKSVSKSVYLVYLFCADGSGLFFALGQGTGGINKVINDKVYETTRLQIFDKIQPNEIGFESGPLKNGSLKAPGNTRAKAYEKATIMFKFYSKNKLKLMTDKKLTNDYKKLAADYSAIIKKTLLLTPILQKENEEISFDVNSFYKSITDSNLKFHQNVITRFISSLLTKPFVIFTGLSGSGKTKLAEAFSMWICESSNQYCMVSVGADWTNREPLLGFPNALEYGKYVKPDSGVLDLIIRANNDKKKPYFLILDEMNMSHVERYFADFLSAMETVDRKIMLHPDDGDWDVPSLIDLPKNLFILGTVNIDETTYMFSPKVLDRANVIEFRVSEDEMKSYFKKNKELNMELLRGAGAPMAEGFVTKSKKIDLQDENIKKEIMPFFNKLQEAGAEFGYRTAFEIGCFVKVCTEMSNGNMSRNDVVDAAIMQKLLPKIHGSRNKIEKILKELGQLCIKIEADNPFLGTQNKDIKYPISYEKLKRMHERVITDGFTSFAEA